MRKHKGKDKRPVLVDRLGIFRDEGDDIVLDSEWSRSVGFYKTDSEMSIPKDHLAKRFRWLCVQTFSDEYWQASGEDHIDCLWRLQAKMMKRFKREMKAYIRFETCGNKGEERKEKLWYKMICLYISYHLYSEFYSEFDRIESVFDNNLQLLNNRKGDFSFWSRVLEPEKSDVKSISGINPYRRTNANLNPQDDEEEED
ncbi:MAG: hypothetical protein IJF84_13410 [Thermoguttaceae bacterium]|nr:hypothetical protein [Thermoguttaceae bacterium]